MTESGRRSPQSDCVCWNSCALAGAPKVLLRNETLAGLRGSDIDEVTAVAQRLAAQGVTVAIIEHTMQAMVRLVDSFVVLDIGGWLAEGQPADITRNPVVIDACLGRGQLPTISNGAAILDPDLCSTMNLEQLEGVMSVVANRTTGAHGDFIVEV